jgi:uncharacterized protein HemX
MAAEKSKSGGSSRFKMQNPRASRSGSSTSKTKKTASKASSSKSKTKETKAAKASSSTAKTKETKATGSGKKPPADLAAQIDGLRGWLGEIERKQGRMTYFGAAGLLIAIAAAGAALYFGITTHNDAATKTDLDQVEKDIAELRTEVTKANQGKQSLNQTLTSLQQQLKSIQAKQQATDQQIQSLKSQPSAAPGGLATPGAQAPTVTTP